MVYVETSLVLMALRKGDEGEEARNCLEGLFGQGGHLSELVLAEVHNLDEPRREWVARLLKELPFPLLRVNVQAVELANRYVYNKVLEGPLRDLGLHAALASIRGMERLATGDGRFQDLLPELERVNDVAGYPIPGLLLPLMGREGRDEELDGVRALSWRVTSRKKVGEVVRTIQEMADSFMREKGLELEKVGRIEIF